MHCADLPFFWSVPEAANVRAFLDAPVPPDLVAAMHGSWVDFVRSGDPGSPAYEAPTRRVQVWDEPPAVVEDGLADVREVWWPDGAT